MCCPIKLLVLRVAYLNSNHLSIRVTEMTHSLLCLSNSLYLTLTMLNCAYIKNDYKIFVLCELLFKINFGTPVWVTLLNVYE